MKKAMYLLAFWLFILGSCEKEPVTPNPTNQSSATPTTESYFTVDGVQKNPTNTIISIQPVVNQPGKYSLSLTAIVSPQASESLTFSSHHSMVMDTVTITINNNGDMFNSLSYSENAGSVYSHGGCSETIQGSTAYGSPGKFTVSKFDLTNKKISGNYSMTLCKGPGDYRTISGYFSNFDFILIQ